MVSRKQNGIFKRITSASELSYTESAALLRVPYTSNINVSDSPFTLRVSLFQNFVIFLFTRDIGHTKCPFFFIDTAL